MKFLPQKARRFVLAAAGLIVLLIIVVIATSGGGDSDSKATAKGAVTKTSLVVLEDGIAPTLDGDGPNAAQLQTQETIANLMDPLVTYPETTEGKLSVPNYDVDQKSFAPALAESYTQSADGLTFTFKLRQGVTSCAGNTMTADDVVYTYSRAKSVSGGAPIGWFLGNVGGVFDAKPVLPGATAADKKLDGEVTKVDDYTVKVKLHQKNELYPRVAAILFLAIYDKKVMEEHATTKDPWSHEYTLQTNAPGFGPYCLKSWTKGSQMVFTANPKYYGGAPQFKTVTIRSVPQIADRVAAIKSGAADVMYPVTPQAAASLNKTGKAEVLSKINTNLVSLGMSFKLKPWSLPKNNLLRQAVAYALPYDDIIKQIYLGNAKKAQGVFPSSYYGFSKTVDYTNNIEKAKQLLVEAGYPGGKGLEKYKDGLTIAYTAERSSVLEPMANRIRSALAQIGINVTLNPIPSVQMNESETTKGNLPMWIRDQLSPVGTDVGFAEGAAFASPAAGGSAAAGFYTGSDAQFTKQKTEVGEARLATLKDMQNTLMNDLPIVPILEFPLAFAVRRGIGNIEIRPDQTLAYHSIKSVPAN